MKKQRMNRKKRVVSFFWLMICTMGLLSGCGGKNKEKIESIEQLNQSGYKISVDPGSAAAVTAMERFPNAEIVYNSKISDAYLAVSQGKTDAFVYGKLYLQYAVASESLDNLAIMGEAIDSSDIAVGISPDREDLLLQINAFIKQIKEDGTLEDMYDRWVIKADTTMPKIEKPQSPKMTLKIGTSGLVEPMNYFDENQNLTGFDVEFIYRMGAYLNADIELEAMSFDALVASLESGRLDAVVSDLNVTEERKEVILMSEPYMVSETAVLVQEDRLGNEDRWITSTKQLQGKRIGITEGSSYEPKITKLFPDAEIVHISNYANCITAMQNGKIDAYITDEPIARYQSADTPDITYLPELLTEDKYAYVVHPDNKELAGLVNQALAELKEEGVLEELAAEWIDGEGIQEVNVNPEADTSRGILKVITNSEQVPFSYIRDNKLVGYDIELITRIAEKLGYKLEIENADFATMIPSIISGKSDIAVGCITVTEERAESVLFTDSVYDSGIVAVVLTDAEAGRTFFESIAASFRRTFITENRWKIVLNGLLITIWLSFASAVLGTLLGFLVSFPLRSKNKLVNGISSGFSTVLNGLPLVVILMVLYYIVFKSIDISAVWVGIIGFTLDFANTTAGLLNTGVLAVDKGQLEAAESMGYTKWQAFCKITMPQATHQMFGQYQGAIVGLIKGTAIIGYITVEDLTKASDIIRSRTYEAFFPLISTAVLYFIIAYMFVFILRRVGVRLDPKRRPRKVQGVRTND